jgi:hypothetical protein
VPRPGALVVGGGAPMGQAASASRMGRFETEWLARPENPVPLPICLADGSTPVHQRRQSRVIVFDMDLSESPTSGEQAGQLLQSHFGWTCHHPLSPNLRVQPAWRSGAMRPAARRRPQRRRLARSGGASDRPLSGHGEVAVLHRRRGLCQNGDLKVP